MAGGNDRTLLIAGGAGLLAVLLLRPQLPASVQAATPSLPAAPAVRDIVVNQTPAPQAGVGDYSALLGSLVALQRRQDNIVESVQRNAAPANPFTLPSINITLPTISNVVNPPAAAPVEDVVARVNETVKTIVSTASGIVTGEELALADVIDTGGPFFGVLGARATGEQPFTDWQEKAADVVETATETLSEYMARIGIAPSGEDEEGLDDLDIFGSFTSGLPALAVPDVVAEGQAIVAAAAERFDVGALTSQARARADELAEQFADLEVVDTVRETAAAATEKLADLTANINLETLSAPTEAIRAFVEDSELLNGLVDSLDNLNPLNVLGETADVVIGGTVGASLGALRGATAGGMFGGPIGMVGGGVLGGIGGIIIGDWGNVGSRLGSLINPF